MMRTTAEIALGRALAWLRWAGAPPGPETTRLAVDILAEALAKGEADLIVGHRPSRQHRHPAVRAQVAGYPRYVARPGAPGLRLGDSADRGGVSGDPGVDLRRAGLLAVPADLESLGLLGDFGQARVGQQDLSGFEEAIIDPMLSPVHRALARPLRRGAQRERLLALRARCLGDGPAALSCRELGLLAEDADSLEVLHRAAWSAPSGSFWGDRLDEGIRRD